MNIYLFLIEIDYTIVDSIYQLWENTTFDNSNITPKGRNKYKITFNYKENQGKSLINTKQMAFDEHKFVFNRNRLHHCVVHTQIMGNQFFYNSNTTHEGRTKWQVIVNFKEYQG